MAKRTFFQRIGLVKVKRGRQVRPYDIVWTKPLQATSLVGRDKKPSNVKLTKREKKIALGNIEGAGLGFVIGTALGGFTGMAVGVPLGTYAGNVIAKRQAGKQVGRPMRFVKKGLFNNLLSSRQDRVEYNKKMIGEARKK